MATNPMQRKARNSFLLGIILTLIITGVVIAFLFLQLKKVKDEQAAEEAQKVNVYTLNQDIKSGQALTEDMFSIQTVNRNTIPSNATSVADVIDSWFLQTKDGKTVNRDSEGLYIQEADSIIELYDNDDGQYYKIVDGEEEKVSPGNNLRSDDDGNYMIDNNQEDTITRIYQDETTSNYYIYELENSGNSMTRTKVFLEFNNVPVVAKVDMNANTVITPNLVAQSDEVVTDDVRREQYNCIILPMDLMTDDYIDIRLMLPNGQNFIVISKVSVEIPQNADGTYVADSIIVNLREDEILALSSAIVEAYGITGARLYANKYTDPGLQEAAIPTYVPNNDVTELLDPIIENNRLVGFGNPNLVPQAMEGLKQRYENTSIRNEYVQPQINNEPEYNTNVQTGLDQDAATSQETRKQYLESLGYEQ